MNRAGSIGDGSQRMAAIFDGGAIEYYTCIVCSRSEGNSVEKEEEVTEHFFGWCLDGDIDLGSSLQQAGFESEQFDGCLGAPRRTEGVPEQQDLELTTQ